MKRFKTKQIALCVAAALAASAAVPAAFAASFSDTEGHWAENAINVWSDRGVIQGFDGLFNPNAYVTRAEAASILAGAIGYTDEEGTVFTDVADDAWYAVVVKKASAAKAINGDGTGLFRPNDQITREEAAVIFANAFGIEANADLSAFSDAEDVAAWAKGAVGGMTAAGYLSGDNGAYYPKRALTRAEMVTILNNMVKTYIDQSGTYTQNNTNGGIILVKAGGVTLNSVSVDGIVISPAVGNGTVVIQNATTKRQLKNLAPDANIQTTNSNVSGLPGMNTGSGGISNAGGGGGGGGSSSSSEKYSKMTVDRVLPDTNLSGKRPEDLMEDMTVLNNDYVAKVKGTLKYVTGFTEYSDKPAEQNGYFIAFRIVPGSAKTSKLDITLEAPDYSKSFGNNDLTEGSLVILRRVDSKLLSRGFTCNIDLDGNGNAYRSTKYTIDLSGVKLEPSIQLLPVDDTAQLLGEEKASDLMENIEIEKKSKNNIEFNATGSLKYYSGYKAFSDVKKEQSGNYLAVRMIPKIVTDDMTVTITGTTTKTFSKKENPEVFEEDGSLITIWRVTEALKEKNIAYQIDYDGSGTAFAQESYILDIVDVELLEQEKIPALAFAAAPMEKEAWNKTQADFVKEFRLSTNKDKEHYVADGALRYVEKTGYWPGNERDNGHFVILEITPDPEKWRPAVSTITRTYLGCGEDWGTHTYSNGDLEEGKLYLCVRTEDINKELGFEVTVDFDGEEGQGIPEIFTIDFANVEELPAQMISISSASDNQEAWNKTQADFVEDFAITDRDVRDGFDLKAAGTMKFAEGTGYWPDDERDNGHFVILEITPAEGWDAEAGTITREYVGRDEEWAARTYGNDSLEDGRLYLCVRADDILDGGLKISIDLDGDGETFEAQSFVIDFAEVQMLPKPAID